MDSKVFEFGNIVFNYWFSFNHPAFNCHNFAVRSAPLNFGLWTAMVRAQGSGGYMNSPMPVMGSYLLVFAILAGGLVLGITNLYRSKDHDISRSAVIATYASSWGILSMPYYTGRSWPSHIHVFFIPLTLCIFGIAGIFYYSDFFSEQKLSVRQIFCVFLFC